VSPYYSDDQLTLWHGDALQTLAAMPAESADCVVTSPPYFGLRDYGVPGQYGLEATPAEYVETMRAVFAEVRRVLAADGVLWLNIGDSYASTGGTAGVGPNAAVASTIRQSTGRTRPAGALPPKNLLGIPWRVAFALQDDGWILRSDVIWHKGNAMPESVGDRPSCSYEHLFLFAKQPRYWFDLDAIREPLLHPDALDGTRTFGGNVKGVQGGVGSTSRRRGQNVYAAKCGTEAEGRNPGDVWTVNTSPFPGAHFAVMPPGLVRRCVVSGCKGGGAPRPVLRFGDVRHGRAQARPQVRGCRRERRLSRPGAAHSARADRTHRGRRVLTPAALLAGLTR
jgi:DNA methylase